MLSAGGGDAGGAGRLALAGDLLGCPQTSKHLVLCRLEQRPAHLDLTHYPHTHYPHLPVAQVAATAVSDYLGLLSEGLEGLPAGTAKSNDGQHESSQGREGSEGRSQWN